MRKLPHLVVLGLLTFTCAGIGCSKDGESGDGDGDSSGDGDALGGAAGDGDGDATVPTDDEYFFEATIVGSPNGLTTLNVDTVPEAFAEFRDTPNGERISIHVNADAGVSDMFQVGSQSLRMYLMPYDGLQTYVLSSDDNIGAAYAESDDAHVFYAQYGMPEHGSGSIVISARTDDAITGTFTFTAQDQARVNAVELQGEFHLPLLPDGS